MLLAAAVAGVLIGLSLGALGGGGSILAVPVLVYLLDQSPVAATTGSLLIVGISATSGAVAAWRRRTLHVTQGVVFGLVGVAGAVVGATWSVRVAPQLLLAGFAALMLVVAGAMLARELRGTGHRERPAGVDLPIVRVRPTFLCSCPRALRLLVTAVGVGLLTGFFGVGGGFLVVPALVLALGLEMPVAVGTSLLVIAINSTAAFVVRLGTGVELDWPPVLVLTGAAVAGSLVGARVASRLDPRVLAVTFAVLLVLVASYTGWQSATTALAG